MSTRGCSARPRWASTASTTPSSRSGSRRSSSWSASWSGRWLPARSRRPTRRRRPRSSGRPCTGSWCSRSRTSTACSTTRRRRCSGRCSVGCWPAPPSSWARAAGRSGSPVQAREPPPGYVRGHVPGRRRAGDARARRRLRTGLRAARAGAPAAARLAGRGLGWRVARVGVRPAAGLVAGVANGGFGVLVGVIGILTLIPANGAPGVVPAEGRLTTCSWDIGGPAPEGFWIFSGGQRMLNVLVFVPAGVLLVLAVARWRAAWLLVPLGLVGLAAYSAAIEAIQLELARIDRACDVTDVTDNVTGAVLGVGVGVVLALLLQPWRRR